MGSDDGGEPVTATNSTVIHEWSDAPEDGRDADDWPYPNHYIKSLITGELADRIRARLGQPDETPVFITETHISGGYSEYTQENDYEHTINCGAEVVELAAGWDSNGLNKLIKWLDQTK